MIPFFGSSLLASKGGAAYHQRLWKSWLSIKSAGMAARHRIWINEIILADKQNIRNYILISG
jgi:hypothetical protein